MFNFLDRIVKTGLAIMLFVFVMSIVVFTLCLLVFMGV